MKEQIISFETAKLLKEIGVEEGLECNYVYCIGYDTVNPEQEPIKCESVRSSVVGQFHLALAPTQVLVQKYFMDNYNLYITPIYKGYNDWTYEIKEINIESQFIKLVVLGEKVVSSYKESFEIGLQRLCEYINENAITNSPVGSIHWFNTIVGNIKHIGEFLKPGTYVEARTLRLWGNQLYKNANSLIEGYDKINKS
jgi:hypothetical protein